ncbi:MAG: hypothetical protein KDJ86_04180 [Bauldia sp.]|uniref:hypothetical protein n=1 Tax=Bauldia sp. TaxID=2575872 RepID=UPI001D52025A|nr:hypothetical protein [Bauldia sp.]MCB1494962.1 hypothetical protein [Bauldia sp.]
MTRRQSRRNAQQSGTIEELLRIRREAGDTAAIPIGLLDDHDVDPDLEDGGDDEPLPGWTTTVNQAAKGRHRFGCFGPRSSGKPAAGWTRTFRLARPMSECWASS